MDSSPLPLPKKMEFLKTDNPYKKTMVLEPCFSGYGLTVGNALRRVVLSSLPGSAVIAVKINGVEHEFSTIPHVKEDVVDIILNFKKLRLKVFSDDEVRLTLKAKGEKAITAADISKGSTVEIVNTDLHLFTICDPKATVEMEIFVRRGRGYEPTETRENAISEVGVINIDALYSPVKNVGYSVENVRVGQITNFERLSLDIETDGTMEAEDAVYLASKILIDHFKLISEDFLKEQHKRAEEEVARKAQEAETVSLPADATEE